MAVIERVEDLAVQIVIDKIGTVLSCNSAVEAVFGWTAAELIGGPIEKLIPADLARKHRSFMVRYQQSHVKRVIGQRRNVPALHKNGHQFACSLEVTEDPFMPDSMYGRLRSSSRVPAH